MSNMAWTYNGQVIDDGFYLLKDGELYRVDPRIKMPLAKKVNIFTGETTYPTNADKIRNMTDDELAEWLSKNDPEFDEAEWWLRFLKTEVDDV